MKIMTGYETAGGRLCRSSAAALPNFAGHCNFSRPAVGLRHSRALPLKPAFTLIELLVVIGIIGLLASLLLPLFGRARAKSRNAVCISNLRQLGLAVRMYTDE